MSNYALIEMTEKELVLKWRCDELKEAGYSGINARRLALDQRVDLHDACDLIKKGCDEGVAMAILL